MKTLNFFLVSAIIFLCVFFAFTQGNVGIGTAVPVSRFTIKGDSTDIRLDLNSTSIKTTQDLKFAVDNVERSTIQHDRITNSLVIDVDKNDQNSGDIEFKKHGDDRLAIRNNGDVQFKKHGDDRLAIRGDNGNIGIGTSIPASKLTIKGDETDIRMDLNLIGPGTTQGIQFAVDGIERSSVQLDKISNNLTFDVDKNDQNSGDIIFKKHGDDRLAIMNNGDIQFKRYGDDRLAIRGDNGNIGIGTSIPASRLTIKGDETDIRMDLNLIGPGTTQGIQFAVDGIERSCVQLDKISNNLTIDVDKNDQNSGDIVFKKHGDDRLAIRNNGDVQFKKHGDDRLAIKGDNGNVGIGTANPVTKLDVNGSVKVANDMTPPGPLNAGAIRYRVEGNSSICEMVMQTGPVNYAWVIIRVNTW